MDRYREHKHFALLKTIIIGKALMRESQQTQLLITVDECKARRALGSHQSIHIKTDMAVFSGGRPGASSIQYSCDLILRDDVGRDTYCDEEECLL
jgi:hypothetical protein